MQGKPIEAGYSGKAHQPGGTILCLLEPDGFPLWISEVEPGSVHDTPPLASTFLAVVLAKTLDIMPWPVCEGQS